MNTEILMNTDVLLNTVIGMLTITFIIVVFTLLFKVISYLFSLLVPVARSAENVIISTITVVEEVSIALKDETNAWVQKEQDSREAQIAQRVLEIEAEYDAKEAKETLDARVAAFKIKQAEAKLRKEQASWLRIANTIDPLSGRCPFQMGPYPTELPTSYTSTSTPDDDIPF